MASSDTTNTDRRKLTIAPRSREKGSGGTTAAAQSSLRHADVVLAQRERADAFARRLEVGVQHRRRRDADRRLADAAPRVRSATRHDDRLDLRHLVDAHGIVRVEVEL